MSTFITHEELRVIVLTALAEEHGAESVSDKDFPLPDDGAVMQASTMSVDELNEYATADHGQDDSALLVYCDVVAEQLINGVAQ